MKVVITLILFFFICCTYLKPILDGRVAPIVLDTRYTFTDFEWARGYVTFRAGFDLPVGGTVVLRLDGSGKIGDFVNLNGGTLILEDDIYFAQGAGFAGDGFIQADSVVKFYGHVLTILDGGYIRLIKNVGFSGIGPRVQILPQNGAKLDMTAANFVSFDNCIVNERNTFITSVSNPLFLQFRDSLILPGLGITAEWFHPDTSFSGVNRIGIFKKLKLPSITVSNNSQLIVESGGLIELTELDIRFSQSKLILVNSILDFTSTLTDDIQLGLITTPDKGSLVVDGQSIIRSSTGNKINVSADLDIELLAGARLEIDAGTHLVIQ